MQSRKGKLNEDCLGAIKFQDYEKEGTRKHHYD